MGLPNRTATVHKLTIPSTKKELTFKPFLHKHQQSLMMAMYSENADTIMATLADTINDCVNEEINIFDMPVFDIQYILLKMRMMSIGEGAKISLYCQHCDVDREAEDYDRHNDGSIHIEELELAEIEVNFPEDADKKKTILYDNKYIIELKYPTFSMMNSYKEILKQMVVKSQSVDTSKMSATEQAEHQAYMNEEMRKAELEMWHEMMRGVLHSVYEKGNPNAEVSFFKDETPEDIKKFIEQLSVTEINGIKAFIDEIPGINKSIEFDCGNCGAKNKIAITGTEDFL